MIYTWKLPERCSTLNV